MSATTAVPLIVKLADTAYRPPQFVKGAHGSYHAPEGTCAPSYVEVWFAPLAAYTLLGLPLDKLCGETVDLVDVLGAAGRRLGEQVREAPTWRRRFTLLDEFLLDRLDRGPRPSPQVRRAWQRLVVSSGAVPVGRIATEVGWSHKHLITKFRQQIGVAPKTAAGLVRFDDLRRRLDAQRSPDWGRLAAEAGYADQAHLVRDFRRYTGNTPTEFLARTRPQHNPEHDRPRRRGGVRDQGELEPTSYRCTSSPPRE
jgi:AraC-like DNA-binding protein